MVGNRKLSAQRGLTFIHNEYIIKPIQRRVVVWRVGPLVLFVWPSWCRCVCVCVCMKGWYSPWPRVQLLGAPHTPKGRGGYIHHTRGVIFQHHAAQPPYLNYDYSREL